MNRNLNKNCILTSGFGVLKVLEISLSVSLEINDDNRIDFDENVVSLTKSKSANPTL